MPVPHPLGAGLRDAKPKPNLQNSPTCHMYDPNRTVFNSGCFGQLHVQPSGYDRPLQSEQRRAYQRRSRNRAVASGYNDCGECRLGAVHGDDAEVLRPDGLNAWAEQAVGLVQNQGLVGFAGASGSRTRHGIFLSVARVKQSLKPKGRTGGGKKSLFQRTPIPRGFCGPRRKRSAARSPNCTMNAGKCGRQPSGER